MAALAVEGPWLCVPNFRMGLPFSRSHKDLIRKERDPLGESVLIYRSHGGIG